MVTCAWKVPHLFHVKALQLLFKLLGGGSIQQDPAKYLRAIIDGFKAALKCFAKGPAACIPRLLHAVVTPCLRLPQHQRNISSSQRLAHNLFVVPCCTYR